MKYTKKYVTNGKIFITKDIFTKSNHPSCSVNPKNRSFFNYEVINGILNPDQFEASNNDYWQRFNNGLIKPLSLPQNLKIKVIEHKKYSGIDIVSFKFNDCIVFSSYIDFKNMFVPINKD
jgi:hypothetical protein